MDDHSGVDGAAAVIAAGASTHGVTDGVPDGVTGGPIDRAIDDLTVLTGLVQLGWLPPPELLELVASSLAEPVASVSEDRAVATASSRRLRAQSRDLRERASSARAQARTAHTATADLLTAARALMDLAATAVNGPGDARPVERAVGQTLADLQAHSMHRANIYRAVGMLMATRGCDTAEAWRELVETSQHTNRKIREVAAAMTEHVAAGRQLPRQLWRLPSLKTAPHR